MRLFAILFAAFLALSTTPGLAKDPIGLGEIQLGTHVDSENRIPVPKSNFRSVEPIYISIEVTAPEELTGTNTVGVAWTYGAGKQPVYDGSRELEIGGVQTLEFHIEHPDGWPIGNYNAEIFINGQSRKILQFSVR